MQFTSSKERFKATRLTSKQTDEGSSRQVCTKKSGFQEGESGSEAVLVSVEGAGPSFLTCYCLPCSGSRGVKAAGTTVEPRSTASPSRPHHVLRAKTMFH